MSKEFNKTLFGYKPDQVKEKLQQLDTEYEKELHVLQLELEKAKSELKDSEQKLTEAELKLRNYVEREHIIADVMLNAQINAQKIEDKAQQKAQTMLETADDELKQKLQELDHLRSKIQNFKKEFSDILDNYKSSIGTINEPSSEIGFKPTLIVKGQSK